MNKEEINDIIRGLELIASVTPDYSLARSRGISDEDAEEMVEDVIGKAIDILDGNK